MARKQNIRYLMKSKLESYEAYGQSKHDDKVRTERKRLEMRKKGASRRETLEVNYCRDKIYSYKTMETYQNEVSKFADWLEKKGLKKTDWDTAKGYIQDYIDYLVDENKSAWSCNTALSALAKTFQVCAADYDRPIRHSFNIIRGTFKVARDELNDKRAADILAANRIIGIRRNELKSIKVSNFHEYERNGRTIIELSYVGKGGKNCHSFYYDDNSQEYIRKLLAGKKANEKVFNNVMKQFSYDADLHSARREAAVKMYDYILGHPEEHDFFMSELTRIFDEKHKRIPDNLEKPYRLRGKNKEEHEKMGLKTEVDRFAALCVSTLLLNHYRVNVSVTNYLLHP